MSKNLTTRMVATLGALAIAVGAMFANTLAGLGLFGAVLLVLLVLQRAELEATLDELAYEKAGVERFQRFSMRLAAQTELKPLAELALAEIGDIAKAQIGALYVLPAGSENALLMGARGLSPSWLPTELNAGHGLAGRALDERRPLTASYGRTGLVVPTFGTSVTVQHELHVPLLQGDRTVGVMSLGRVDDLAFSPSDVQSIEGLAERAAVGLSNAIALLVARDQAAINKAVLETAADAFISLDANGIVTQWNSSAETMFGFGRASAIGVDLAELIIPERHREAHRAGIRRFVTEGDQWRFDHALELTALTSDGREFPVEATITPLQLGDTWQFNAFIRDISDRKRTEQHEAAHYAVIRALAASHDLDEAQTAVVQALATSLDFEYGAAWVVDPEIDRLRCVKTWSAADTSDLAFDRAASEVTLARGEGIAGGAWETGEPFWAADLGTVHGFQHHPLADADGFRAAVAIPISNGSELVGVVQLFSRDVRKLDPALVSKLATIGPQVGEFIARKRAEAEAERLKDEFFALVSHELRTPLTSIIGYLELVLEEPEVLDPDTQRFLEIVDRNGKRLLRLVDDLLFVARVEAGEISLDHGPTDLAAVVSEAVDAARPRATDKGVELWLDVDRVPVTAADAGRLGQAVDNLISNAIKFTDTGGRVVVTLTREGDRAAIRVSDTGMGIARGDKAKLFERFFRSANAVEQAVPGVGLGLTIAKAIVDGHHGMIDVDSEEGNGTTFTIRLPLASPETGSAALPSSTEVRG